MEYLSLAFSDLSLKDRFDVVKSFPAKLYDLDKISNLHTNLLSRDQDNLFRIAMGTWRDSLDKVHATDQLGFGSIKSLRLSGNLLRSAFCLFDAKHLSPLDFHELVSKLGKLKDFREGHSGQIEIDENQILAKLKIMQCDQNDLIHQLNIVDANSTWFYMKSICRESLFKICGKMTITRIHEIRKCNLRHLLHFYQLNVMNGKTEALPAYQHIKFLYDQFDFVRKSLSNLSEETKINIPPILKDLTIETLKMYL